MFERKKILVVDDEAHIRKLVGFHLERWGYIAVMACDGRECMEKVRSEKPDLVVLDIRMPFMDGFEVVRQMKVNPYTAEIPIIIVSAKVMDADVSRGYQSGVDVYLTKPLDPRELWTFIKRVLGEPETGYPIKQLV